MNENIRCKLVYIVCGFLLNVFAYLMTLILGFSNIVIVLGYIYVLGGGLLIGYGIMTDFNKFAKHTLNERFKYVIYDK